MDANNKRIVKNSAFLYVQMAIRIIVSLYTTRVILHALGAEDFGINNVVGGVVVMFVFISDTMSSASQRFFACEVGLGDRKKLNQYFNTTIVCYIILITILFIIVEVVGYWVVNYKLIIPPHRLVAANWVLQFSIIAFVVRMMSVPFGAMIIAYERIAIFAIVGLMDSLLTLAAALFIQSYGGDRLIVYSLFLLTLAVVNALFCVFYCRYKFKSDVRIKLFWNKSMFVELVSYSGWSLFWTLANVVRSQGLNILLNVFFNPVVNAARGIAYQVNNVINQYTNSFYQAVRPQITKYTACDNIDEMMRLMFSSSRISFHLLTFVTIPLIVKTPYILSIWLEEAPPYTVIFMRLIIVVAMIDALGHPPTTAISATGKIKWYHITIGSVLLMNLPISYIFLLNGAEPFMVFIVSILLSSVAQGLRVLFMKKIYKMSVKMYCKKVMLRIALVVVPSFVLSFYVASLLDDTFPSFCLFVILTCMMTAIFVYRIGIPTSERDTVKRLVQRFLKYLFVRS